MINVVCGIRSTGRICTDLATALEAQGHEVKIAYGRENVPEQFQKYAVRIGTDLDVKLHGIKARLLDGAGFGSKKATEKFIKWVKEYDPDVIHLHNIHGYYINVEVLFNYLKVCSKKIIWTLHDCWAFTGHTAYCDAVQCERWKTGCYECPQIKEYPKSIIDRSKLNWKKKRKLFTDVANMTIVTPSHWLAGLVKESFLNNYEVQVIHNGIDTSQFRPLDNDFRKYYGIENKRILLGVATAWNDMKGYSDFIKLSMMLDDSNKIVLVGLSDNQLKEIPNNILGIKRTASVKELAYIYSAADVFLNLSYCENYPTVNLESRACGTPVVTYNTGGSPESAGPECVVVEKGNLQEVISAINNLPSVVEKDSSAFDEKVSAENYLGLYKTGGGYWTVKSRYNLIGKSIILGVAAIWDRRKGLDDFITLSERLSDDYQIILVGLTKVQISILPNRIIGISHTNSVSELADLYSIADVFVNPTYEDNYPTTNLEAISCGTPVITYATGGSPESASFFGTSVTRNDIRALIDCIHKYDFYWENLSDISLSCMLVKYLKLFEKILRG